MKRLAILSTHPIQYNAPLFRMLHENEGIKLQVFFSKTWDQVKFDPDFQREVVWDIPVSEGYPHATHDASSTAGKSSLGAAIRDFGPDALLVYGWNFPGHLAMMRTLHGSIPIWFRGDSNLLKPLNRLKTGLRKLTLTYVYRHIDVAYSVGIENSEYFLWSGVRRSKIKLAPHAVDNRAWQHNYNEKKREAAAWRQKLGINTEERCIGFAGKLEAIKQIHLIIEAVQALGDARPHLIIAGTGPLEQNLREIAIDDDKVHFLGFVNQSKMPLFYRMLDLFVLPSISETWGLSINEAICCGTRCAVSPTVGCGPDVFDNPNLGEVVSAHTRLAWSAAIQRQLQAHPISQQDLAQFEQRFNYGNFIEVIHQEWSA